MERLFSKLSYTTVKLWTPADISQFSFIVQKSVCPLNLQICQSYIVWDGNTHTDCPTYSYSRDFINTEEKCRKVLSKSRRLLYTLNLDLPIGREWSLKSPSQPNNVNSHLTSPHIAKITIDDYFYSDSIYGFFDYAYTTNRNHLKIVKWSIRLDVLDKDTYDDLPFQITNCIVESMHPELEDLEFVRNCFRKLDLISWVVNSETSRPGTATNLLYLFHRIGRNVEPVWTEEFTDFFLSVPSLHLVADVLKLKSTPSFSEDLYGFYLEDILIRRVSTISSKMAIDMSQQRHTLLLQVFWVYLVSVENREPAIEYLSLIWSAVPDWLLSPDEITAAFVEGFTPEEIEDVKDLYSAAVGNLPANAEPRPLSHYCRTTIRRLLHQRKIWLPEGIKEAPLPNILKLYLNLEW